MSNEPRSWVEDLREKSKKGEVEQAEIKRRLHDDNSGPALTEARRLYREEFLPAIETAAENGKWHVEKSMSRSKHLNEEVFVRGLTSLLIDKGVRADVTYTVEHLIFHVSWLPDLALVLRLADLTEGKAAVFGASLRAEMKPSSPGQLETLWVRCDAEAVQNLAKSQHGYKVVVERSRNELTATFYGRVEVHVGERPDPREYLRVTKISMADPQKSSICFVDLRKIHKELEEIMTTKKKKDE